MKTLTIPIGKYALVPWKSTMDAMQNTNFNISKIEGFVETENGFEISVESEDKDDYSFSIDDIDIE